MGRFLAYVVLVMMFAHITLNYSLFGTSQRADKYIQDLVNTYFGDRLYSSASDDITVLLLTDEALDIHQGGHWPASYDFHGRVLHTMLKHRPAAVFIDFLWLSQRPDATVNGPRDGDYLIKTLQRYKSANIPVFLASNPAVKLNWPELNGLVTPVNAQLEIDFVDFVSRSYPTQKSDVPTPAFQIVQDIRPELFQAPPTEPMEVFWGTSPNWTNLAWMTGPEGDPAVVDILLSGYGGIKTSIPFSTTLFVRDLLNPVAATPEQANEETDAFIKDKVVMYGANLAGVNDLIFTPTRDILPGVYLHAMALDNLFHWGGDYKSANGSGLLADKGWRDAWSFLIVLPVAMLFALFHGGMHIGSPFARLAARRDRIKVIASSYPRLSSFGVTALVALWFAGWAFIEFIWFDVSAATVAGYIEFIAVGFFVEKAGLLDWLIDTVLAPVRRHVVAFWRRRCAP